MNWDRIIPTLFGAVGWIITSIGAYMYGGLGLCLISIGLPFMIHNWDIR